MITALLGLYSLPALAERDPFTVIVLPDTQYYSCDCNGGTPETFEAQTAWIAEQREALDIAYVAHVGDCVENGDEVPDEWGVADRAMSALEDPETTGLAEGIPYGIAVGNHDQTPFGDPSGSTAYYNSTFGMERFAERSWYGGSRTGTDNDDHYATFRAGDMDFLVVDLEYDQDANVDVLNWLVELVEDHPDHRVILVAHYFLDTSANFSPQGGSVIAALSDQPNVFLMLGGHYPGEARRTDATNAGTVHTLLADYQSRDNGGDGWLRALTFVPDEDRIDVWTYSPTLDATEDDDDSAFSLDYDMSTTTGGDSGDDDSGSGDSTGTDDGGSGQDGDGDGDGDSDGDGGADTAAPEQLTPSQPRRCGCSSGAALVLFPLGLLALAGRRRS